MDDMPLAKAGVREDRFFKILSNSIELASFIVVIHSVLSDGNCRILNSMGFYDILLRVFASTSFI